MADGKVDGTAGGDNITLVFTDADGDHVDGADGNDDTIYGYGGNDTISGGQGNDTLYGGSGDDTLRGNSGDDLFYGGHGNDSIEGRDGNDTLSGGAGSDTIEGDAGSDVIYVQSGDDFIYGESGDDLIYILAGTSDWIDGQSGDDTINLSMLSGTTITSVNYYGGSSVDGYVLYANGERMEFRNVENLEGTQDGTVDGTTGNDSMGDGFSDGQLDAIGNSDANHNDNVMAYGGADTVSTGQGDDTIYGGTGNDSLTAGSGDDALYGDSGDDELYGGDGSDTLFSGAGNDTYNGGTGMDYIDFGAESSAISIDLDAGTIGGAAAGDVIGVGIDGVFGTGFDDTISGFDHEGSSGDNYTNRFYGRAGDDIMNGRGSADYLDGGSGEDTFLITGSPGNDTIVGGEGGSDQDLLDLTGIAGPVTITYSAPEAGTVVVGADTITFSEIETIYASSGADTVTGSTSGDTIYGDAGNDEITANAGNDSVLGGAGRDTIYGGAGIDSLTGDSGDDFLYGGANSDTLAGGYGADSIEGGSGDDTLLGLEGQDTVHGGNGDDSVLGGSGDDDLFGGAGNDTIYGGAGADTIEGGLGDDVLFGGTGADTVRAGQGNDSITALNGDDTVYAESGDDRVTLSGPGNYALFGGEDPGDTDTDILDVSALGAANQINAITYNSGDDESGTITFTNGDVATFSGFEQVICFAQGTRIQTNQGYRRVENLRPGDMIQTMDNGPQPLRWVGQKSVSTFGPLAPVTFAARALGNDRILRVSPQHRMLIRGWKTEMLFGETEVLVAAKHLIGGLGITQDKRPGKVAYYHLCLDQHQIIFAEGAPTESFLPAAMGLATLSDAQRADLAKALPHLGTARLDDPVRPILRAYEAKVLSDPMTTNRAGPSIRDQAPIAFRHTLDPFG